jgi:hypothetical protein
MKKDTKRIEALLEQTQESIALVREEMKDGASLQHVYDELKAHEVIFSSRLKDLVDWNKKQAAEAKAKADAEAKAKADAEAKAKADAGEKANADAEAPGEEAPTGPLPPAGQDDLRTLWKDLSKDDLILIKKDIQAALKKEPVRADAKSALEIVNELLKKFN